MHHMISPATCVDYVCLMCQDWPTCEITYNIGFDMTHIRTRYYRICLNILVIIPTPIHYFWTCMPCFGIYMPKGSQCVGFRSTSLFHFCIDVAYFSSDMYFRFCRKLFSTNIDFSTKYFSDLFREYFIFLECNRHRYKFFTHEMLM